MPVNKELQEVFNKIVHQHDDWMAGFEDFVEQLNAVIKKETGGERIFKLYTADDLIDDLKRHFHIDN